MLYGCIETTLSLLVETEVRLDSSDKVLYRKLWLTHLPKAAGSEGRPSQHAAGYQVLSPTATSTLLETCSRGLCFAGPTD